MDEHRDHWKEPESITDQRPNEERWCEFCGEEIPYHDVSCKMLKVAYTTRRRKCDYCLKVLQVGGEMFDHVVANHMDELKMPGISLPEKRQEKHRS